MNIIERLQTHWFGGSIVLAVICISATWFSANELMVKPRDFTIKQLRDEKKAYGQLTQQKTNLEVENKKLGEASQQIVEIEKKYTSLVTKNSQLKVENNRLKKIIDKHEQRNLLLQRIEDLEDERKGLKSAIKLKFSDLRTAIFMSKSSENTEAIELEIKSLQKQYDTIAEQVQALMSKL